MAEILASIQRILSEGEPDDRAAHAATAAEPASSAAANQAQAVAPPAPARAHDAAPAHEAPDMHDDQEPPIGDADVLILEKSMMVAPDGALAEPLYKSPLLEAAISRDAGTPPPPPSFGLTTPHPFPLPEEPEVAPAFNTPASNTPAFSTTAIHTPAFHAQAVAHAEPAASPAMEAEPPPQAVAWSPPPAPAAAALPAAAPVAEAAVLPAPVAPEPAPLAAPPVAVSHSLPVAHEPAPVMPLPAAPMAPPPAPPLATDGLVGAATAAVAATAIGNLVRTITAERNVPVQRGGLTIEDLVREELRPLLRAWLETHLPPLVEKLVQVEIERVVNRATS